MTKRNFIKDFKYQKKIELNEITGSYHSLEKLHKMNLKFQTPETPNILGIYLLMKVTEDMIRNGIDNLRRDTNYKSTLIYGVNLPTK